MIQVLSFGNDSNANGSTNGSNSNLNQQNAQSGAASTAATPSESVAPFLGKTLRKNK